MTNPCLSLPDPCLSFTKCWNSPAHLEWFSRRSGCAEAGTPCRPWRASPCCPRPPWSRVTSHKQRWSQPRDTWLLWSRGVTLRNNFLYQLRSENFLHVLAKQPRYLNLFHCSVRWSGIPSLYRINNEEHLCWCDYLYVCLTWPLNIEYLYTVI